MRFYRRHLSTGCYITNWFNCNWLKVDQNLHYFPKHTLLAAHLHLIYAWAVYGFITVAIGPQLIFFFLIRYWKIESKLEGDLLKYSNFITQTRIIILMKPYNGMCVAKPKMWKRFIFLNPNTNLFTITRIIIIIIIDFIIKPIIVALHL